MEGPVLRGRSLRAAARGTLFGRRPRLGLAVRTALAATLAWQLALWLPFTAAETYPYYAPLGAVVGSYTTVRSSIDNSLRAVAGILLGGLLALGAHALLGPGLAVVAVVVFTATLLAGWAVLGSQRSWVLSAAVFVLIVGAQDPVDYVAAYSGLTLLGGLVAVGVNALLPDLPLLQSDRAAQRLADVLADQLDDLAEGLRRDTPPSAREWSARLRSVEPLREQARERDAEVRDSLRANVRARRHRDAVRRRRERVLVLASLALRVEELTALLVEVQNPAEREVAMEAVLRQQVAAALTAAAAAARALGGEDDGDGGDDGGDAGEGGSAAATLREEVRRLSAAVSAAEYTNERDRQTAGAVVTLLRRALGVLRVGRGGTDPDPEAVAPTPWTLPGAEPGAPGARRRRLPRWPRRPRAGRQGRRG
ncbi:FUSC family protein [Kineococcus sp. SYSU DK005]|uniref:FUSC family protein n=1 Tax=Kineococcus sp. SYSU DK005 TaxID=3383126 RepID=UPI003D7C82F2